MKRMSFRNPLAALVTALVVAAAPAAFAQEGSARLLGIKVSPTSVPAGGTVRLRIALTRPAPAGGLTVAITSAPPKVLPVPQTIRIPAGVKHVGVTLTARSVRDNTRVNLTGSQGDVTRGDTVTVTP